MSNGVPTSDAKSRTRRSVRHSREGLSRRQVALGAAGLLVALALLLAVGLLISDGFAGLSDSSGDSDDEDSARAVASDLLVLTLLSGVVAAAVTEFLKRVLRLRESFNRAAVRRFLHDLADFRWGMDGPEGLPLVAVPPTYGAPLSQLCAQLGQALTLLATALGEGQVSSERRGPALRLLFDDPMAATSVGRILAERKPPTKSSADWREPPPRSPMTATLLQQAERQLDAFQLRTRAQWHRMLQWISAGVAAGFMLCVGVAVDAGWEPVVVGCLLGLTIGGPVAWTVRDVVRVIERRGEGR